MRLQCRSVLRERIVAALLVTYLCGCPTASGQAKPTILERVEVFGLRECVAPGLPDAEVDAPLRAALLDLIALGDRHLVPARERLDRARFGSFAVTVGTLGMESVFSDNVLHYAAPAKWKYEWGPLVRQGQGFAWTDPVFLLRYSEKLGAELMRIPGVEQLGSRAFVAQHCFRLRAAPDADSSTTTVLEFRTVSGTRFIDFDGSLVLDSARTVLRSAHLYLSRMPESLRDAEFIELVVAFKRDRQGYQVIDSAQLQHRIDRPADYLGTVRGYREVLRRLP